MRTILFICTGNTCRSPMAEAIAQRWLDEGGLEPDAPASGARYLAVSAGVAAGTGGPTSPETVAALAALEIPYRGRSKPLTAEMIRKAEVVLVMTERHAAAARALLGPGDADHAKIRLIDPDGAIDDPIGLGQAAYDELAQRFMDLVPRRLKELLGHEDRAGIGSSRR